MKKIAITICLLFVLGVASLLLKSFIIRLMYNESLVPKSSSKMAEVFDEMQAELPLTLFAETITLGHRNDRFRFKINYKIKSVLALGSEHHLTCIPLVDSLPVFVEKFKSLDSESGQRSESVSDAARSTQLLLWYGDVLDGRRFYLVQDEKSNTCWVELN